MVAGLWRGVKRVAKGAAAQVGKEGKLKKVKRLGSSGR